MTLRPCDCDLCMSLELETMLAARERLDPSVHRALKGATRVRMDVGRAGLGRREVAA